MTEHVLDDLEAYALGALDDASAGLVAAHLAACPSCRAEAASLADVVGALPDSVLLREPRPALRERVLAAARAGTRGSEPASRGWSFGRVRVWPVVMASLASVVLLLAGVMLAGFQLGRSNSFAGPTEKVGEWSRQRLLAKRRQRPHKIHATGKTQIGFLGHRPADGGLIALGQR